MTTRVVLSTRCPLGRRARRRLTLCARKAGHRRLVEDVAFRVLAAGNVPDHRTIGDFRQRHLAALQGLFEQVLRLARELGAPRVGRVALGRHEDQGERLEAQGDELRTHAGETTAPARRGAPLAGPGRGGGCGR